MPSCSISLCHGSGILATAASRAGSSNSSRFQTEPLRSKSRSSLEAAPRSRRRRPRRAAAAIATPNKSLRGRRRGGGEERLERRGDPEIRSVRQDAGWSDGRRTLQKLLLLAAPGGRGCDEAEASESLAALTGMAPSRRGAGWRGRGVFGSHLPGCKVSPGFLAGLRGTCLQF